MKKIILSLIVLLSYSSNAQTNPIDFETPGNGANWTWNTFENGDPSAPLVILPNPDMTGINTSATVASYTPLVGSPFYAGAETAVGSPFGPFTLTSSNCIVRIKVWKPVLSNVGIKFAANFGSTGEINVPNTVTNQWEELIFDFSSKIGQPTSTGIDQFVVFIDSDANRTTDNTCYFDDITFGPQSSLPPKPILPLDFESSTIAYSFVNFGGSISTKIMNPDMSGINTSTNVAKLTKNSGETWGGSFLDLETPIDFSNSTSIKVKTWSPGVGRIVKLKLENLTGDFIESDVSTTVANSWEELTFSFPGVVNAVNYQKVVMFFNFGVLGTGENYYFDDVKLVTNLSNTTFEDSKLQIYPNPATNNITIDSKQTLESIRIYNTLGQEVLHSSSNSKSQNIDVSNLVNGIYFIVANSNEKTSTLKFIKK